MLARWKKQKDRQLGGGGWNLSNAGCLPRSAARPGNLDVDKLAEFLALVANVLADFFVRWLLVCVAEKVQETTIIFFRIHQLLGRDHVEQLQHSADLQVGAGGSGHHGHGVDAHLDAGRLAHADGCALDLEEAAVSQLHAAQSLDGDLSG